MTDKESGPDPSKLAVGDRGPEVVVEDVERREFVRYAGASGDFNPIHYDEPYTHDAGYPSVFGQGMFTAGVTARAATDWFGIENIEQFSVRFRSKLWPGDSMYAICEVTDIRKTDEVYRVDADLRTENQEGELLLTGDVTARLTD